MEEKKEEEESGCLEWNEEGREIEEDGGKKG